MTGRRATPGHEEQPAGSAVDDGPSGTTDDEVPRRSAPPPRAGAVAPQPRPGPAAEPDSPPALPGQATGGSDRPVAVEPTTGAPVDAVPSRVPVRQPGRRPSPTPGAYVGTRGDDNGLFWAPIEEVHWDGTPLREEHRRRRRRRAGPGPGGRGRPRRAGRAAHPPEPWRGLSALLALSLLAAFFAWVSAGPFWLAVGHGSTGTAVVGACTGSGLSQRCRGIFTADGERFAAFGVRITGVPAGRDAAGSALPARMTGPSSDTAYTDTGAARQLRWPLGLLLVLSCGAAIARYTGATRFADRRARRWAVTVAMAGPLVITAGFLAYAW
ncbi:hypothetical protein [Micromonospora sp. RTGN7]|uniref:hypothetical protein n=1 Tax=Micromonospora sp. RTGN7 TaxID=3016526 RepID=UPI0029FF47AA|nr:hypothetical protein [Micromonospora sp. RTGN7]